MTDEELKAYEQGLEDRPFIDAAVAAALPTTAPRIYLTAYYFTDEPEAELVDLISAALTKAGSAVVGWTLGEAPDSEIKSRANFALEFYTLKPVTDEQLDAADDALAAPGSDEQDWFTVNELGETDD